MIKTAGGEVLVSRLWERRPAAIGTHRKALADLFPVAELDHHPLNRNARSRRDFRHPVLKIHPHLVEAVLGTPGRTGPAGSRPWPRCQQSIFACRKKN
jgi:hypothetical protein